MSWPKCLVALLILIVSCGLRLDRLIDDPVWHDELITIARVEGVGKDQLVKGAQSTTRYRGNSVEPVLAASVAVVSKGRASGQVFMPAFYLIQRFLGPFEQPDRIRFKLLSFVCGAVLPLVVWSLLATVNAGFWGAALGGLLAANHPMLVGYSVEARPYALLLLALICHLRCLAFAATREGCSPWVAVPILTLGALTHLLFLPIAVLGWMVTIGIADASSRRLVVRQWWMYLLASAVAMPWIYAVLTSVEAGSHYTLLPTTIPNFLEGLGDNLLALAGLSFVGSSVAGYFALLVGLASIWVISSGPARAMLLTLLGSFVAMVVIDVSLGGTRSLVPRYNIQLALFFCLCGAFMCSWISRRSPRAAITVALAIIGLQSASASTTDLYFKGGRYEEMAWYLRAVRDTKTLVLTEMRPMPALELVLNGGSDTTVVRVAGALPSDLESDIREMFQQGGRVMAVCSGDRDPPNTRAYDWRWREDFRGTQRAVYTLVRTGARAGDAVQFPAEAQDVER